MERNLKVNELPAPTWNRLGMNATVVRDLPPETLAPLPVEDPETGLAPEQGTAPAGGLAQCPSGLGEAFCSMGQAVQAAPVVLRGTREGVSRTLHFPCGDTACGYREVDLLAEKNETLTVWMQLDSPRQAAGVCALRTCIRAGEGARVRLVQVQMLGDQTVFLNDVGAVCGDGAAVELVQVFLGGSATYAGCRTELNGTGSSLQAAVGYLGRGSQRVDLNYTADHHGRRSSSQMQADGVLQDGAFKIFRGTIDFKRGAVGAEGAETETVLMLGEDAVSQTVPLILCAEEDVQGSHGASIGQPDEAVLFYLGSRGIDEASACSLLARARLDAVCNQIGNEAAEQAVHAYLAEVMGDDN